MSNNPICPIFIVGPSRCGNTLLQEVLNLHSRLHICSETHWFDDDRSIRCHAIETDEDRKQSQDWFLSLSDRPFGYNGDPDQGWLDRSDLEREARAITTDAPRDSYFVAWCQLDAAQHGKARWGEKTPRHVFRISDILQAFPGCKNSLLYPQCTGHDCQLPAVGIAHGTRSGEGVIKHSHRG